MRWLVCSLLIVSSFVYAQQSQAKNGAQVQDCQAPGIIAVPDGNNASSQEMLDAQPIIEDYIANTRAYLTCLLSAEQEIGDALTYEQKKESITHYNLAVDRAEAVVERFNKQLRVYQHANEE